MPAGSTDAYSDRYVPVRLIARGGMAEVWFAHDTLLDRTVALKVLFPELSVDKSFVERFRREAQAAANLSHPNIVSVYDWGEADPTYFIVMEYVEGLPLSALLREEGPLDPVRAATIAADVGAALGFADRNGVIHRDVKPGNVLLADDDVVKVTDFGIARANNTSEHLTKTGAVMGTATYFSPEQAQGVAVDQRSDVYSLGVVLYEMVTGTPPFVADGPVAVAYKHVHEDPVPPSEVNPEVPADLEAVIFQALAKDVDARYATAEELRADLGRFVAGRPVLAEPVAHTEHRAAPTKAKGRTAKARTVGGAGDTAAGAAAAGGAAAVGGAGGAGGASGAGGAGAASRAAGATDPHATVAVRSTRPARSRTASATPSASPSATPSPSEEVAAIPKVPTGPVPVVPKGIGGPAGGAPDETAIITAAAEGLERTSRAGRLGDRIVATPAARSGSAPEGGGAHTAAAGGAVDADERPYRLETWVLGVVLGVLVLALFIVLFLIGRQFGYFGAAGIVNRSTPVATHPVVVPADLVGKTFTDAANEMNRLGVDVNEANAPSNAPVNTVIQTVPPPGQSVAPGQALELELSEGAPPINEPDVVGENAQAAAAQLQQAGFSIGPQQAQNSASFPSGQVIASSPPPGYQGASGQTVTLTVSSGPGMVAVPSVTGQTQSAAMSALQTAGFQVEIGQAESSGTVPSGSVVSTNPAAGAQLLQGSYVSINVSSGPATVRVPYVLNYTQANAVADIQARGLVASQSTDPVSSPAQNGVVIDEEPGAGVPVQQGSTVDIVVGQYGGEPTEP